MAQPATNPKIEELRTRLKSDPKNRIFYPLAEELRKVGEFAEAEQVLRTGLGHHPTYLSAWVSLGRVLRELKNDRAAIEALSRALQLDPGNVVAARLLGDAYLNLGDKVEAIKKYKLLQALLPGDEEVDSIVEQLDRELNPPAAVSPPEAEQPAAALAAVPPSGAADEESPFAPEPEASPFEAAAATPFEQPLASSASAEMPFAPMPGTGEETKNMRPAKKPDQAEFVAAPGAVAESPFAAEPQPAAAESPFASEAPRVAVGSPFAAAEPSAVESPFGSAPEEPVSPALIDDAAAAALARGPAPEPPASWPPSEAGHFEAAAAVQESELPGGPATSGFEPMAARPVPSPFEEQAPYGADASELESPQAPNVEPPALAAEVSPVVPESEFTAPVEESDVFAPAAEPMLAPETEAPPGVPQSPAESGDLANTLTMADLYARQGLVDDARRIYETILQRDPQNAAVREKVAALTPVPSPSDAADEKVAKLQRWLTKMGKREVGSV